MSYEPTLIIVKEDLHKQAGVIEEGSWQEISKRAPEKIQRRKAAFKELEDYLSQEGHKIREITLIMVNAEGSIHNRTVRELLHELDIEFAAYD